MDKYGKYKCTNLSIYKNRKLDISTFSASCLFITLEQLLRMIGVSQSSFIVDVDDDLPVVVFINVVPNVQNLGADIAFCENCKILVCI